MMNENKFEKKPLRMAKRRWFSLYNLSCFYSCWLNESKRQAGMLSPDDIYKKNLKVLGRK